MNDLIVWVRARLDDDERVAREARHPDAVNPGTWTTEHHNSETHREPDRCHIAEDRGGHYWSVADEVFIPNAEHMARWDPARGLAEVEARRRRLDYIEGELADDPEQSMIQYLAKVEALPYAHEPGWRQEWHPEG